MIVGIFLPCIRIQLIKIQLEFIVLSGQNQMYALNYKHKLNAVGKVESDT